MTCKIEYSCFSERVFASFAILITISAKSWVVKLRMELIPDDPPVSPYLLHILDEIFGQVPRDGSGDEFCVFSIFVELLLDWLILR